MLPSSQIRDRSTSLREDGPVIFPWGHEGGSACLRVTRPVAFLRGWETGRLIFEMVAGG